MKTEEKTTKAYKVTDANMQCRGFQFNTTDVFEHKGKLSLCNSGFHACLKPNNCFNYYSFDSNNRVFEIEVYGEFVEEGDKLCAAKIKFIKEFTWTEVLELVNIGSNNTGHSNTGNWNTGNSNTGYRNTGNRNTGNWNTGNRNTGYSNTGNRNTGNRNTGNWNTGNRNTGYSNTGDRNTGVFCTGEKTVKFFDKDSDWTEEQFLNSRVYQLLCEVDTKLWVPEHLMTEEEKNIHYGYKTAEGFYRDIPFKEAFSAKWHNWSESNKNEFISLPNFNPEIFELITSVKV